MNNSLNTKHLMTLTKLRSLRIPSALEPEALIWIGALLFLAFSNPESEFHFTIFWPSWFFDIKSPGYGLGHSISWLSRGEISRSLDSHWLGIPTVIILVHRIVTLQINKARLRRNGVK